jgi:hypothetical protein
MFARILRTTLLLAGVAALVTLTGCRPELTNEQALPLIQAHYDQTAAVPLAFQIDQSGLQAGILAKYWTLTKVYPANKEWGDFTLTADGKKLIKLPNGKDIIEWRQDPAGKFQFALVTVTPLKFKARDIREIRKEVVPGVKGPGQVVVYMEAHDLTPLPNELQDIILHNSSNKIAEKRQADMAFENGAWAFHNIEE